MQDHVSFCTTHPGHIPGDKISVPLAGGTATVTLFPPHCVAGSQGAQLAPGLNATWLQPPAGDFQASSEAAGQGVPCCLIRKGILPDLESFSAFYDMARRQSTGDTCFGSWTPILDCSPLTACLAPIIAAGLSEWLRGRNVRSVALVGVATEFCVRLTALDALQEGGWEVVVVADGVGAVDTAAGSAALEEVQRQGGKVMTWRQYCVSLGSS